LSSGSSDYVVIIVKGTDPPFPNGIGVCPLWVRETSPAVPVIHTALPPITPEHVTL
jgi:hypothetical protein